MNVLSRGLVLLAVVSHVSLGLGGAFAKPGGPGGPGNGAHGGPTGVAPGGATAGNHGVSTGATGGHYSTNSGHIGGVNSYGGHYGDKGPEGRGISVSEGGHGAGFDPIPVPIPFAFAPPDASFTAVSGSACGFDLQLFDPGDFTDVVDRIASISQQTQGYITGCGCNTQTCVADALDKYADALDKAMNPPPPQTAPGWFAPPPPRKLPKAVRELPRIVHEAADRVRAAKTPHAAETAVRAAVELVHKTVAKTISLMRASDPDAKAAATRSADLVADTLTTAATALMRPDSL